MMSLNKEKKKCIQLGHVETVVEAVCPWDGARVIFFQFQFSCHTQICKWLLWNPSLYNKEHGEIASLTIGLLQEWQHLAENHSVLNNSLLHNTLY